MSTRRIALLCKTTMKTARMPALKEDEARADMMTTMMTICLGEDKEFNANSNKAVEKAICQLLFF